MGNHPFYRWPKRDYHHLFPRLPHRTHLFRVVNSHRLWTDRFLAARSLIGLVDTYGIELIHLRREGRSQQQIGRKGLSNRRWITDGKLCLILNYLGLIFDWDVATANVYDGAVFQEVVNEHFRYMVIFADEGFVKRDWYPDNLKIGQRGKCNAPMIVETVLSMLTFVCHFKKAMHRA